MTDLRRNTGEDENVVGTNGPSTGTSRWQKAVGAGGLVAVLWVGVDSPLYDSWFNDGSGGMNHGPSGGNTEGDAPDGMDHGPGGEAPEGEHGQDVDSGGAGPDSSRHDPPPGDHG